MKHIVCLLALVMLIHTFASAQEKIFLRFYDFFGYKFEKGQFIASTDSSIVVSRDTLLIEILISSIYSIKTRRSFGHQTLVSSLITGIPLTIYAVSVGEPPTNENTFGGLLHDAIIFTPGEAAVLGILGGIGSGTILGALLSANNKTLLIGGDKEIWKRISKQITTKRKSGS